MRVAGFVLAGGQSRRMGRDKALLPAPSGTLLEHVAACMLAAAGNVTIVGHPERYASLAFPAIGEDFPGCGPLSGIEAALRAAGDGWALIAACDMPGLTAEWIRHLIDIAASDPGLDAVVSVSPGQRPEPLCAAYHARLHGDIRKSLKEGRFAVKSLLSSWRVHPACTDDRAALSNINTPEDWAAWNP